MQEYIEIFRVEAKSLLKNFRNNDKKAIARCKVVYGDRSNLSLMNMQHVVAKEYGFNDWNELQKAEDWLLAEALIKEKNKEFVSPFVRSRGRHVITSYLKENTSSKKPDYLKIDVKNLTNKSGYPFLTFEHLDISDYDLSEIDILNVRYSEDTIWPKDKSKLPQGFEPKEFLEYRKNPGLGIRQLHKQGIDGRGRNVAIIDDFRLFDHLEYHNQLKGYEEIHIDENSNRKGLNAALVSSLVGRTCGVAPKANLYYYAVDYTNRTQVYYTEAIRKVCELHKKLISEGQIGIDAILTIKGISSEIFKDEEGYIDVIQAVQEATQLGIWCRIGPTRFKKYGMWREGRIYCKFDGDVDNPDDYVLNNLSRISHTPIELLRSSLNFPCGGWTHAQEVSMGDYVFDHCSGPFTAAYAVGLYLLAKSVKPDLNAEEYWRLGIETGDFRKGIGTIVNPQRLINELRK